MPLVDTVHDVAVPVELQYCNILSHLHQKDFAGGAIRTWSGGALLEAPPEPAVQLPLLLPPLPLQQPPCTSSRCPMCLEHVNALTCYKHP
jgi:hypothetical protein